MGEADFPAHQADWFIANCNVGDCRGFDSNAEFSQSRVQLYINPETREWEVKYNSSSIMVSTCGWTPACAVSITTRQDSAAVFDPAQDVTIENVGADGSFHLTAAFKNNFCKQIPDAVCPPIYVNVRFYADASRIGGFRVEGAFSAAPSVGFYNYENGAFQTMTEVESKTRSAVEFFRKLRSRVEVGPALPPPEQPSGCYLY